MSEGEGVVAGVVARLFTRVALAHPAGPNTPLITTTSAIDRQEVGGGGERGRRNRASGWRAPLPPHTQWRW